MSDESSGRKRAFKKPEDPVHQRWQDGKWYFHDENGWVFGPYDTEAAARRRLEVYLEQAL